MEKQTHRLQEAQTEEKWDKRTSFRTRNSEDDYRKTNDSAENDTVRMDGLVRMYFGFFVGFMSINAEIMDKK